MPQQINLHHPVLLAPRRHLQARTIALALALWALALLAMAGWSGWRTQAMRAELALSSQRHAAQKALLAQAQAARQAAIGSPAALKEESAHLQARLAERRHLLALLEGGDARRSPTVLLRELAEELPSPVWLTEIRWNPAQVELAGRTLQPEALQTWIARRGTPQALRVEQQADAAVGDSGRAAPARHLAGGWSFRWRQGHSGAGTAPSAATVPATAQPTPPQTAAELAARAAAHPTPPGNPPAAAAPALAMKVQQP